MQTLLGIDAGTTALKAVLFNTDGRVLGSALQEYQLFTPTADVVELDAETYWHACCQAVREVVSASRVNPREVVALSIASQGETLIAVDARGNSLRRAIVWLDNRAADEAKQIENEFGADNVFQLTGQPEIVPTWPACKILWLREHEPERFKQTAKFLLVEEFLIYKFTGRFVAEKSVQTSSLWFDIRRKEWWREMHEYLHIGEQQLGELVEPGEAVEKVSAQAAAETGLSTQTLVVSGAMDQMASAVGAGNIEPGLVSEMTGGALAVCATLPGLILDPERRIATHYHAVRDAYCLLPYGQIGGMALRWFRDTFCETEMAHARENGTDAYDLLTRAAAHAPPGCQGLVFLPHLSGAASPEFDPEARGVFYGIALNHTKSHFARAILESVAYMLKKNLDMVEKIGGAVTMVRAMGGGARSALWLDIKADVLQKDVLAVAANETGCLGAAILAGVAANVFTDLRQGVRCMSRTGGLHHPNPERVARYQTGYQEYLDLYESLAPMFKRSSRRHNSANSSEGMVA
jgi:xylulokinase